jgi:hypothetical protein
MNSEHMCFGQVKILQQPKNKTKKETSKRRRLNTTVVCILHTGFRYDCICMCVCFLYQKLKANVRYLGEINVLLLSFQLPAFFNISKQIENTSGEKRARSIQCIPLVPSASFAFACNEQQQPLQ